MTARTKKWLIISGVTLLSITTAGSLTAAARDVLREQTGFAASNIYPAPMLSILAGVGATSVLAAPIITIFYRKTGLVYLGLHVCLYWACVFNRF